MKMCKMECCKKWDGETGQRIKTAEGREGEGKQKKEKRKSEI